MRPYSQWCASQTRFSHKSHIPSGRTSRHCRSPWESFWTNVELVGCHILPYIACTSSPVFAMIFTPAEQTLWKLSQWMSKQRLAKSMLQSTRKNYLDRNPGSSVEKQWITTQHSWTILCFEPLLHTSDWTILVFIEALLIRLRNPALCTKKPLMQNAFAMGITSIVCCTKFNLFALPLQFKTECYTKW